MARYGTAVGALALAMAMCPAAPAPAQPVFFDDFNGNALAPHWSRPPDSHWEYNVSGGMLNVTELKFPSDPHFGGNEARIGAGYAPQTDFRADVWMGWEAGDPPHRLGFYINSPQGIIAAFGYRNFGAGPEIFAGASNEAVFVPAPPPGMYHFTIRRVGVQNDFYFNDDHFARITSQSAPSAFGLTLDFLGPYPGQFGALHIDRIVIVPAPGALIVPGTLALFAAQRRRR